MLDGFVRRNNEKKKFLVCAPTGRASKILRNKTGYGKTIHSTIYDFDNLITINSENEDFALETIHINCLAFQTNEANIDIELKNYPEYPF